MMMSRARWWAMYLFSAGIGYVMGGVLWLVGWRFKSSVHDLVQATARGHAEDAEHRVGPYLAPVTFVVVLLLATAAGIALVRFLS